MTFPPTDMMSIKKNHAPFWRERLQEGDSVCAGIPLTMDEYPDDSFGMFGIAVKLGLGYSAPWLQERLTT